MAARITIETASALKLTTIVLRQIPYATNNALNRTALEARDAGRDEIRKRFTIRTNFAPNRVQILKYSRTNNLTAVVGINSSVQGTKPLLAFFEMGEGGIKTPVRGSEIAVPITGDAARPSFSMKVSETRYSYKRLNLNAGKGRLRTFVIPGLGVYRRTGPGKRDIEIIYAFETDAPLRPRMTLRERILAVIQTRFREIWFEEMHKELTIAGLPKWKTT